MEFWTQDGFRSGPDFQTQMRRYRSFVFYCCCFYYSLSNSFFLSCFQKWMRRQRIEMADSTLNWKPRFAFLKQVLESVIQAESYTRARVVFVGIADTIRASEKPGSSLAFSCVQTLPLKYPKPACKNLKFCLHFS